MPGRPFQSSLEPHLEIIRALRLKRRTWRQIAEALKTEHGLEIDPAAIYKFFKRRVRPSARQPLGFPTVSATGGSHAALSPPVPIPDDAATDLSFEPIDPNAENPFKMRKRRAQSSTASDAEAAPSDAAPATPAKKYVFIPKPERPSIFSEEDLQLNDPLAIEPFGKPVDSVAQNLQEKEVCRTLTGSFLSRRRSGGDPQVGSEAVACQGGQTLASWMPVTTPVSLHVPS